VRPRQRDLNDFGRRLDEALAHSKYQGQHEFCEEESIPYGTLVDLKHRRPPRGVPDPEEVRRWGLALGLGGEELEELVLLSQLVATPPYVVEALRRARGQT
jgi:hypothetical protein